MEISTVGGNARLVEAIGYDESMVKETKDDPFVIMALVARTSTTLGPVDRFR